MNRYKKGDDRNQLTMEPMCLDDMISADAEVRALELIVLLQEICQNVNTRKEPSKSVIQ